MCVCVIQVYSIVKAKTLFKTYKLDCDTQFSPLKIGLMIEMFPFIWCEQIFIQSKIYHQLIDSLAMQKSFFHSQIYRKCINVPMNLIMWKKEETRSMYLNENLAFPKLSSDRIQIVPFPCSIR